MTLNSIFGWFTHGHITRTGEDNITHTSIEDTTLVSTYNFGAESNWSFDARWNIGSGFPFTQTQGFYPSLDFSDGINTNYTSESELGIIYAGLNQGRLPWYHRLDISLKKQQKLSKYSTFEWNVGVTNVYKRKYFLFNRVEYKRVNQLPFMPSAGVSLTFKKISSFKENLLFSHHIT